MLEDENRKTTPYYKRRKLPEKQPSLKSQNTLPKTKTDVIIEKSAKGLFERQATSNLLRKQTQGQQNDQTEQQLSLPTQEDTQHILKTASAEQEFETKMLTLHSNFDELSKEVLRTKYSRLLVALDVVIAVLASLMMAIGIIESTRYNLIKDPQDRENVAYRFSLTSLAILTSGLILLRTRVLTVKQFYQRRLINKSCCQRHIRVQVIVNLAIELMIILVNPIPMADLDFSPRQESLGDKTYSIDQFATAFSLSKCIFLLRLIPHLTEIKNDISRKVYELNGVAVDSALFVRIQLKERPFIIQSIVLALMTLQFGFATQLFERTEGYLASGDYDPFKDASNSMWTVILGMTTVGYGDLMPVTHIGRLFVIMACFAGSFIITLMTVTVSIRINHEEQQLQAYNFIKNFQRKRQLRIRAANVIARFYHYSFDKSTQVKQRNSDQEDSKAEMLVSEQVKSRSAQEGFISKKMKLQQAVDAFREQQDFFGMATLNGKNDEKRQLLAINQLRDVKFDTLRQNYGELNPQYLRQVISFSKDYQGRLSNNLVQLQIQTQALDYIVKNSQFVRGKRQLQENQVEAQLAQEVEHNVRMSAKTMKSQPTQLESIKEEAYQEPEQVLMAEISNPILIEKNVTQLPIKGPPIEDVPKSIIKEQPGEVTPQLNTKQQSIEFGTIVSDASPSIDRPESQLSLTQIQITSKQKAQQDRQKVNTKSVQVLDQLTQKVDLKVKRYLDEVKAKELKVLVGMNLKELVRAKTIERPRMMEEIKEKNEDQFRREILEKDLEGKTTIEIFEKEKDDQQSERLDEAGGNIEQDNTLTPSEDKPSNNQEIFQNYSEIKTEHKEQHPYQPSENQGQLIESMAEIQKSEPSDYATSVKAKKKKKTKPKVQQQSSLSILPSADHKPIIKPVYIKPSKQVNSDLPTNTNVYDNEEVRKLLNLSKSRNKASSALTQYSTSKIVPIVEERPQPQSQAYLTQAKDIDPTIWVQERLHDQQQNFTAQSSFLSLWDNQNQRQEVLKMEHVQRTMNQDKLTAKLMSEQMNVMHSQIRVQTFGAPPNSSSKGLLMSKAPKTLLQQRQQTQLQLKQKHLTESVLANTNEFQQRMQYKRRKDMNGILEGLYR